ncbi:hypothetical protein ACQP2F_36670 [Actinoplanes sp. CA-030573]|uniref:hypothetical protein n=1 Tax=Actinoplanes sp. CA-030573 TaxID=3239898 RepID=UPI003D8DB1AB
MIVERDGTRQAGPVRSCSSISASRMKSAPLSGANSTRNFTIHASSSGGVTCGLDRGRRDRSCHWPSARVRA